MGPARTGWRHGPARQASSIEEMPKIRTRIALRLLTSARIPHERRAALMRRVVRILRGRGLSRADDEGEFVRQHDDGMPQVDGAERRVV